jgi:hypothetical protein
MFGFSITKLLFTVAIIVIVWQAFKWLGRRGELQRRRAEEVARETQEAANRPQVEDMVQCPDCGAYVPQDGKHRCA